jgi:DegV family protein with EDD domain
MNHEFEVVTDAAIDLPPSCDLKNIVPVAINKGTDTWLYPTKISLDELLDKLKPNAGFTTSTASPARYGLVYDALPDTKILSVHTSSHTSGIVNAAIQQSKEEKYHGRVRIFDTENGSAAAGIMVERAVQESKNGTSIEATENILKLLSDRVIAIAIPDDDLTYLVNCNRVSGVKAKVAQTLQIRPIIKLTRGVIKQFEQVRYPKTASCVTELLTELHKKKGVKQLIVITSTRDAEVKKLIDDIIGRLEKTQLPKAVRKTLNPAVIVNSGPNTFGFVAETEESLNDIF